MAQLSATLNAPQADTSPVSENVQTSTTGATIVDALSKGLGAFQSHVYRQAEQARANAAAAREQTTFTQGQQDRTAQDLAVRSATSINDTIRAGGATTMTTSGTDGDQGFTVSNGAVADSTLDGGVNPSVDLSAAAQGTVNASTGKIANYTAAAQQGTLNPLAYQALAEQQFHQTLAAHPELNAGVLADAYKKNGVSLFSAYEDQKQDADAKQAAQRDAFATNYKQGMSVLPPSETANMTQDQIAQAGQAFSANTAKLAAAKSAADVQISLNNESRTQTGFDQTQGARNIVSTSIGQVDAALDAGLKLLTQTTLSAPDAGADPEFELGFSKRVNNMKLYSTAIINKAVEAAGVTDPAAAATLRTQLQAHVDGIFGTISARPQETVNAVNAITSRLGVTSSQAFPLLTEAKRLGIPATLLPGVLQAIPPDVLKGLNSEFASITKDPTLSTPLAKIHMDHILGVLTGTQSLQNISGPQARAAVTQAAGNYTTANADAVAAGKQDGKVWLNGLSSTVNAVGSLNRQSGTSLVTASNIIATGNNINALTTLINNPATAEQAKIAASGVRAASAHLTSQIKPALTSTAANEYYKVMWDTSNGHAYLAPDVAAWKIAKPADQGLGAIHGGGNAYAGQYQGGASTPPPASATLKSMVIAMNNNVSFLAATQKFDESGTKGTALELRNYYGHNMPTSAMQKEASSPAAKPSYQQQFQAIDDVTSKTPEIMTAPVGGSNADLIGPEGTGKNPASTASGTGQFINSTWIDTLKKHAPQLVENMSDADIIAMKSNKALATQAVGWYRGDNAQHLGASGVMPTPGNTAVAHILGPQGATSLLKADPNAKLSSLGFSSAVINGNKRLLGGDITVGQAIANIKGFYGHGNEG